MDDVESYCHRCLRRNIRWSAPSPLWNEVMRGGYVDGPELHDGIVCPLCFADLAEQAGIAELWTLQARRVHVELTNTTPDGRVWSDEEFLWV